MNKQEPYEDNDEHIFIDKTCLNIMQHQNESLYAIFDKPSAIPKDYTSSIKRNIENLSLIREICVFIGTL